MALGPKAMGDAIVANLHRKTGKDLAGWLRVVSAAKPADKKAAIAYLKSQGLGQFQAVTVAEQHFGGSVYVAESALVDALFARWPAQRALYDAVCAALIDGTMLRVQPCKGYVPVYSRRNIIIASFKPTAKGLYVGLRGSGFAFETVPHRKSLGGADAMREGIYVTTAAAGVRAIRAALEEQTL